MKPLTAGWCYVSDEAMDDLSFLMQYMKIHSHIKKNILNSIKSGNEEEVSSKYASSIMDLRETKKELEKLKEYIKQNYKHL